MADWLESVLDAYDYTADKAKKVKKAFNITKRLAETEVQLTIVTKERDMLDEELSMTWIKLRNFQLVLGKMEDAINSRIDPSLSPHIWNTVMGSFGQMRSNVEGILSISRRRFRDRIMHIRELDR